MVLLLLRFVLLWLCHQFLAIHVIVLPMFLGSLHWYRDKHMIVLLPMK